MVFDCHSLAIAVQRLVIEAFCLQHSTADIWTYPAWWLKSSVHCSGFAGVKSSAIRRCSNIISSVSRSKSVRLMFLLQMSLLELSWQIVWCCCGEWPDHSLWHCSVFFHLWAVSNVQSLPRCLPVLVCVVVGPGLSLRWMSPSSCPSPSTSLCRSATRATRTKTASTSPSACVSGEDSCPGR